jgi:hypothetical protein
MIRRAATRSSGLRPTPRARVHKARVGAAIWIAATFGALLASACTCGPGREALARASLDTPRGTVEAFGAYMRAGLHDLEYRCFSTDFKARNKLSYFSYAEARDELARSQPWLELFATPKVVGEIAREDDRHDVDVRLAGRTYRVNLVREETFRISAGDEILAEELSDFERLLSLEKSADGGALLVARLPLPSADIDLSATTSVALQRRWKIDGVAPLDSPD